MGLLISLLSQVFPPRPIFTVNDVPDLEGMVCMVTGTHAPIASDSCSSFLTCRVVGGYSGIGRETVQARHFFSLNLNCDATRLHCIGPPHAQRQSISSRPQRRPSVSGHNGAPRRDGSSSHFSEIGSRRPEISKSGRGGVSEVGLPMTENSACMADVFRRKNGEGAAYAL
jgi:hypothetical protein